MKTHIALLRGVNVGGNKKIAMADLRTFVERIGFHDARTLLQSGNLVFRSDGRRDDAALETFLDEQASHHLGLSTKFVARTAVEWSGVITRNPFPEAALTHPGRLLVVFFREPPAVEGLQTLRPIMIASERIHLDGRQIYADLPDGAGNSKLASVLTGPRFSKAGTGRNWNTVLKLGALVSD